MSSSHSISTAVVPRQPSVQALRTPLQGRRASMSSQTPLRLQLRQQRLAAVPSLALWILSPQSSTLRMCQCPCLPSHPTGSRRCSDHRCPPLSRLRRFPRRGPVVEPGAAGRCRRNGGVRRCTLPVSMRATSAGWCVFSCVHHCMCVCMRVCMRVVVCACACLRVCLPACVRVCSRVLACHEIDLESMLRPLLWPWSDCVLPGEETCTGCRSCAHGHLCPGLHGRHDCRLCRLLTPASQWRFLIEAMCLQCVMHLPVLSEFDDPSSMVHMHADA